MQKRHCFVGSFFQIKAGFLENNVKDQHKSSFMIFGLKMITTAFWGLWLCDGSPEVIARSFLKYDAFKQRSRKLMEGPEGTANV